MPIVLLFKSGSQLTDSILTKYYLIFYIFSLLAIILRWKNHPFYILLHSSKLKDINMNRFHINTNIHRQSEHSNSRFVKTGRSVVGTTLNNKEL